MAAPHLVVSVTAHGYGHLAQTGPVLEAVRRQLPDLRITLRGDFPEGVIAGFLSGPLEQGPAPPDFGLAMTSPVAIDWPASLARYAGLHRDWHGAIEDEMAVLHALSPDLVLCNAGYVSLAAAAELRLPAIGLSSLNWADILDHYRGGEPDVVPIVLEQRMAYAGARPFLRCAPGMPMPGIPGVVDIGPIGRRGTGRRDALADGEQALVLVSAGGIRGGTPAAAWPELPGVTYVFARAEDAATRRDALALDRLGLSFIDAMASVDLLITKPGYGMFVEAAVNRTRLLYAARDDWPEAAALDAFAADHACAAKLPGHAFDAPAAEVAAAILALLDRPRAPPLEPSGIAQAADRIVAQLTGR
ncbi:MAG: hypothetical protein J0H82_13995 [Alphaproteobacteria bacterium]|nr:hypothetical protein [Alphaproteobacteria bacterium]